MKKFITFLILISASFSFSQTQINPATQINWSKVTGNSTPSTSSCTTAMLGIMYTNITNNSEYFCGSDGWFTFNGIINSGTIYSPAYYSTTGNVISGVTPFNGLGYYSTTMAPSAATSTEILNTIGSNAITNNYLENSTITINTIPCVLGSTCSLSSAPNIISGITAGNGLLGGGSSGNVTISLSSPVSPSNGGTGSIALTGFVYGNGSDAMTAMTTIPVADLSSDSITINGITCTLGSSCTLAGNVTASSNMTSNYFPIATGATSIANSNMYIASDNTFNLGLTVPTSGEYTGSSSILINHLSSDAKTLIEFNYQDGGEGVIQDSETLGMSLAPSALPTAAGQAFFSIFGATNNTDEFDLYSGNATLYGITNPNFTTAGYITNDSSGNFGTVTTIPNSGLTNPSMTVNGTTCTLGSSCTITSSAGTITVGTTTVASGGNGDILYDNAGVLGDLGTTGSGSVVLSTAPTFTGITTFNGNANVQGTLTASSIPSINNIYGSTTSQFQAASFVAVGSADIIINGDGWSISSPIGGGAAGQFNIIFSGTGSSTAVLTFNEIAAPHGWSCFLSRNPALNNNYESESSIDQAQITVGADGAINTTVWYSCQGY